ncbi:hypothetical protein N7468_003145 [Penicillium chermesinum]|uniref:Enoyl reductase (ER) domain-containing protein n=1 Tax=Penicillium chermesinum TaxID=63820 RepID=A0A9W9P6L9_9EURO|nr:uncharacterized protein N7468_003145 [Penicillium chermesinum]KAJ5238526.1 hypothetical protein N7468_003145 [Penicillium chermesinum]KAJ6164181.1 hypothetical protein N7470_002853 [Penicillium chermesinum]
MARQWILTGQEGWEKSLEFQENVAIPSPETLGLNEVLVRLKAASINYRELMIPTPTNPAGPINPPLVPSCDGAGTVEAIGPSVTEFRVGDRVLAHLCAPAAEARGDDAPMGFADAQNCLGQGSDGTLRTHGVFREKGLVRAPASLDFITAATMTCTWTTAWNALFGLRGQEVGPGSWVLVQGTGGVSVAALQIAVAAGASVVATTSSEEKAMKLRALGAKHVVNYRTNKAWGEEARGFTPGGRGFDSVIEVTGNEGLRQSFASVRIDGIITLVGMVGDSGTEAVPLLESFFHGAIVRPILASSRTQFQEVVRFVDEKQIVPAIDDVVFELAQVKDAYRRLEEKQHFSKIAIRID